VKKFFFIRRKVFQFILFFFLNIFSIFSIFEVLFAQSFLSDPEWVQNNIEYLENQDKRPNITPQFPSELFSTPIFNYESEKIFIEGDSSLPSVKSKINKKIVNSEQQEKFLGGKLTESMLIRLFPWFSNSNESDITFKQIELADIEFSGISMWVSKIQNLLKFNPEKARLKFLEVQEKLDIEDRTLLKVQLYYYFNEWNEAEKLAKVFLRERPESERIPLIYYFLNKSLLAQKKHLNQDLRLRELTIKYLDPKNRSGFLQILSNEAYSKGFKDVALRYRLEELRNKDTSKYSNKKIILDMLRDYKSVEDLKILSESYPNLVWLQEQIFTIQIEILIEQKRLRSAFEILGNRLKHAKGIGDNTQIKFLNEVQDRLSKFLKKNTRKIGVVLPLSSSNSKIAKLAQDALDGLWLALHANEILVRNFDKIGQIRNQNNFSSKISEVSNFSESLQKQIDPWELVVRDSQLNEGITKNVIHELVEKENVIAIIGPLARKTSEAAAEAAELLRVPLLSLSLTDSIPKLGEYIFRNNKSWKKEVSELLDYAISELRACRFLILFTKTREGRQKMRYFWDETLKKNCQILAVEGFEDEGQKSLVNEFDTFTGKNLSIDLEDKNILKDLKEKEDPVHNFDAVFVAVGSGGVKNLRLIFPYSSVYKMEKTTFLGDSGWNDLAIQFAPGIKGIVNPIFVDSFFLDSKSFQMEILLNLHERIFYKHQNYIAPSAYMAYAYDTLMILLELLKKNPNQSHRELKESLLNMEPFPGVTGNLSFDENGEIKRKLKLLTMSRGKIKPLFKKKSN
tara:strand:- start:1853 stop:4240 length:2388 start_codon:yes stop_codon:yes gene_type:complete